MSFEVPTSLIRQVQIGLRKEAGIPSYDPDDPLLVDLPSLDEAIAGLNPSPPYLRCKQCKGRLLRGLQSMVCVYCGAQQRRDILPDPISFKSTFGYRWLLNSLDLNGSEAIGAGDSTKGKNSSKDELVLSDLFDFELKWPAESENIENSISNQSSLQSRSSLNLAGVDLDNFFSEGKKETTESHAFPSGESLSFFENAESSDMAVRSVTTEGAVGDAFSGWEAEFKSASSGTLRDDLNSFNLFSGSSPTNQSSSVEATSGPDTDIAFKISTIDNDLKEKSDSVPPLPLNNSWIEDDQWHTSNTSVFNKTEQLEMNEKANNDKLKDNSNNISSMNNNRIQDGPWPTDSTKASKGEEISADDDSFDAWQEFTSSGNAPDLYSSSWEQSGAATTSADGLASEMNLVVVTKNLQEMSFGSFAQPDLFSGSSRHQSGSYVNDTQEASITDRAVEVKTGGDTKSTTNAGEISDSADSTVEILMSQIHDLSFMLESNLSIPKKEDFDSVS